MIKATQLFGNGQFDSGSLDSGCTHSMARERYTHSIININKTNNKHIIHKRLVMRRQHDASPRLTIMSTAAAAVAADIGANCFLITACCSSRGRGEEWGRRRRRSFILLPSVPLLTYAIPLWSKSSCIIYRFDCVNN